MKEGEGEGKNQSRLTDGGDDSFESICEDSVAGSDFKFKLSQVNGSFNCFDEDNS